jgi:hypothetical protein
MDGRSHSSSMQWRRGTTEGGGGGGVRGDRRTLRSGLRAETSHGPRLLHRRSAVPLLRFAEEECSGMENA